MGLNGTLGKSPPEGVGSSGAKAGGVGQCSVIAHPLLQPENGQLLAVLEFVKTKGGRFNDEEEEMVESYLAWGEVGVHYKEISKRMNRTTELSQFLLTVVK